MNTTSTYFPPKTSVLPPFSAIFGNTIDSGQFRALVNKPYADLMQTFDSLGRRNAVKSAAVTDESPGLKPTFAVGRWLD